MLCKSSMSADVTTTHLHMWQLHGCVFVQFNLQYFSSCCCTAPPGAQKSLSYFQEEIVPKNILMIGPTGCGKTEIARRLAKLADAPFVKVCPTCMQAHVHLPDVLCLLQHKTIMLLSLHTCLTTPLSNTTICLAHHECTWPVAVTAAQQAVEQHPYVAHT